MLRFAIVLCLSTAISVNAQVIADESRRVDDIAYAKVDGQPLLLDLYLPAVDNAPLVVWVHGGAWRSGSRSKMPLGFLVDDGYAVASIDYRLSGMAKFPAQIHDCKAAIRFLRANANKYGYNAQRVAVAGSSAGGHLVAEIGVTNGHADLEGSVGEHSGESSDIQAIVDYYGPTNFLTILDQSTPHGLGVRVPALELLLGDGPEAKPDLAKLASPVFHVDKNDPPLLMIHGDQDPQVPINQSHELHGKYKSLNLDVTLEVVHGGAHGGKQFYDAKRQAIVKSFLERTIKHSTTDQPRTESN
ncbi:MAG: alpha/beta hydrolase [Pirellulaceae bacterium]